MKYEYKESKEEAQKVVAEMKKAGYNSYMMEVRKDWFEIRSWK